MKTAISVADEIFREAERYARRVKKSRSQLYADAMAEYLARHQPDAVTEAMNETCAKVGDRPDPFLRTAARRLLARDEW